MEKATQNKVLLVDDEVYILNSFRRQLPETWTVATALNGRSAIQKIEDEGPFHVIVTDMKMANMDGMELLRIVNSRWPHMICIVLTGTAGAEDAIAAVNETQIFHFLQKPCSVEQFCLGGT